ncbi:MAG: DUF1998 domain-containing protein [Candidatus Riflebacteria bacterium]|nr:DUF1998 domain-containing protein [Candidatus Riflebacteria bacterium]
MEHPPLRPPDLIIQDELHLISGPLGTLAGLYETAVDHLCTWEVDGRKVRPKVIASTATVRRALAQVHSLFLRRVNVFPPHGLDAGDNFFSVQRRPSTEAPGRLYLGLCAPGRRMTTALVRLYVGLLCAAQVIHEKYGRSADPWMTLVGYFSSLRELGGTRRLVDDQVQPRVRRMDSRGLAARQIEVDTVKELTSRLSAAQIPEILDFVETPFDPAVQARRKQMVRQGVREGLPLKPVDVLLATNMISVGVDVRRLGLMAVLSQPKTTAEYIQATSRVGRASPGLVCVLYNWSRPRDLSHYEAFEHYHATFYKHVEALSITPFAPRAIDRGLAALLVSLVRLASPELNDNSAAAQLIPGHPLARAAFDAILARAEQVAGKEARELVAEELKVRLDQWVHAAKKSSGGAALGYKDRKDRKDGKTVPLLKLPGPGEWEGFTCLNSLRDVEPPVSLILVDSVASAAPGEERDGEGAGKEKPPGRYGAFLEKVVLAERLREVRSLIGFTRIESPGNFGEAAHTSPELRAPLSRRPPRWIPAAEIRGEGLFIEFREDALTAWLERVREREEQFRRIYTLIRKARKQEPPEAGFPTLRYVLIHSFSHALLRQLALECGYAAASIRERIYSRPPDQPGGPMAGLLLYTSAPDTEGTLGGLVALGRPEHLERHLDQALEHTRICASDPLCAEHNPGEGHEALHGAACHACLFAAETSCERGNRFLDRTLLVPTVNTADLAYFRDLEGI